MPQESANVLRVYGQANRTEFVRNVIEAIFGGTTHQISASLLESDGDGVLLTASRFDLPDALPTLWLTELSQKMPDEEFFLVSQCPKGGALCGRERFINGNRQHLRHTTIAAEHVPELKLPAGSPPFVSEAQLDGPLPLAAIANQHLKHGYWHECDIASGLCCSRRDMDRRDWHWLACDELTTLLSKSDRLRVTFAKAQFKKEAARVLNGQTVCSSLLKAVEAFAAADVAALLREDERVALDRVGAICGRLAEANLLPPERASCSAGTVGNERR